MKEYYKLKVGNIIRETDDAMSIHFKQPFFGKISYKSGQFLTLVFTIDGREHSRAYSISSTQGIDQDIMITVKRVQGGVISNYIFTQLKVGDSVRMMRPTGSFTFDVQKKASRDIVLFGAGSGITPLMSILKSTLYFEPQSRVTLIYSNKNEASIIFKDPLDILKERFADRLFIRHVLSGDGERLGEDNLMAHLEVNTFLNIGNALIFICGPEAYMDTVKAGLKMLNVSDERIFNESFTIKKLKTESSFDVVFRMKNKEQLVNIPPGKSLLDVGLDMGFRLRFSCLNGQCGTCKSKCVAGTVKMAVDNILSDEDKQGGFILPCVGYPASEGVVIELEQ